jgi:hypothetical protein
VLASPVPRTILCLSRPLSDYELVFSPWVEAEAERHQKAGHVPVSVLRQRYDWRFAADPDEPVELEDTDPKDQPVLAAAVEAGAHFVVTGNVKDFGEKDLARFGIAAVHPGLFLRHHIAAETYREVLEAVGASRGREPRDPLSIHEQEISVHLPALFETHRDLFRTGDARHLARAACDRVSRRTVRVLPCSTTRRTKYGRGGLLGLRA